MPNLSLSDMQFEETTAAVAAQLDQRGDQPTLVAAFRDRQPTLDPLRADRGRDAVHPVIAAMNSFTNS
jgi:hypothetical protein